jgi:GNAT superfamily N-acetyltransferase/ABC-type lipoprotein export system ATPase subunit
VFNSFRVQQIAGMFDVPLAEKTQVEFSAEVPGEHEAWTIGAIVGPSGSGKTTIARQAYPQAFYESQRWPQDRAVVDGFGDHSTREITSMLTAVGFSSPPAWVKPYAVLSNGEKFRCDLARALLGPDVHNSHSPATVVFDEFTSVVDRTVAQVGSAAVTRAIRSGKLKRRFIAVTCHYDVLPWLEPDWVLDMSTGKLTWGRLRRPPLLLEVVQCPQSWWSRFARHHYLSGELARAATCFVALHRGEPVAFCATCGIFGMPGRKRITRIVVLPDYQGLGIGMQLVEQVCAYENSRNFRCNITASHPAVISHCKHSALWRVVNIKRATGPARQQSHGREIKTSTGRSVVSFEFIGSELQRAA